RSAQPQRERQGYPPDTGDRVELDAVRTALVAIDQSAGEWPVCDEALALDVDRTKFSNEFRSIGAALPELLCPAQVEQQWPNGPLQVDLGIVAAACVKEQRMTARPN